MPSRTRWLAAAILSLLLPPLAHASDASCRALPAAGPAPAVKVPAGTRIGLALGSGSMHGLAHVGIVQELEALKVPVAVVAGTSVGALVGGLWASGLDGQRIAALSRDPALEDFSAFAGSWQGLYRNDALYEVLDRAFERRPIESWPRRFGAVATDITRGERRLLSTGDGALAVQASSAVPVLFRPVIVAGERLVDGALVEPVPVIAARDLGANFVIAVDVAYRPHEGDASGITQYAFQAMHVLVNSLATAQMRNADAVIRLNLHERFMRCGRDSMVEAGREALRRAWPDIQRSLLARPAQ